VDVLNSLSRLAKKVTSAEEQQAAGVLRRHIANYEESEDLISVGAYEEGSNAQVDEAIAKIGEIRDFLSQRIEERAALRETLERLSQISGVEIPLPEEADETVHV
jgi:flagellum-specific ATP synthase